MRPAHAKTTLGRQAQEKLNKDYKGETHIKNANLQPKICILKLNGLPYFCPRLIYGRNITNPEACGH